MNEIEKLKEELIGMYRRRIEELEKGLVQESEAVDNFNVDSQDKCINCGVTQENHILFSGYGCRTKLINEGFKYSFHDCPMFVKGTTAAPVDKELDMVWFSETKGERFEWEVDDTGMKFYYATSEDVIYDYRIPKDIL